MRRIQYLRTVIPNPPGVVYKRPPNLRNMLVNNAHIFLARSPLEITHHCNFTQQNSSFNHPHTGPKYNIKSIISCSAGNVAHIMSINAHADWQKTTRPRKTRIPECHSTTRNNVTSSLLAVHFYIIFSVCENWSFKTPTRRDRHNLYAPLMWTVLDTYTSVLIGFDIKLLLWKHIPI